MKLPKETVRKIYLAASIHDVGKVDTPPQILNKPGLLTDEEFTVMKRHSVRGAELVERLGDPEITAMVRHHHERMDGQGYPDQLAGNDIPLGARVIAVADTFDAIVSDRPYRAGKRHKEAIAILKQVSGTQLDDIAVRAFLDYYSGKKAFVWWMSISVGAQRMVGSFGSWLQNAPTTVAQGTASLGAAVVLASAASGASPALVQPSEPQTARVVAGVAAGPQGGLASDESADALLTGEGEAEGTKESSRIRTASSKPGRTASADDKGAGEAKPAADSSTGSGGGAGSETSPEGDSDAGKDGPAPAGDSEPPDDSGTGGTPDTDDDSGSGSDSDDPLPEVPLPESEEQCKVNLLGVCVNLP
jgi:hypothetical protein